MKCKYCKEDIDPLKEYIEHSKSFGTQSKFFCSVECFKKYNRLGDCDE